MITTLTIRASMLPGWADCARRAAAKQYQRLIESHGFALRKLQPAIGAPIGTAVHAAAATLLKAKRDNIHPNIGAAVAAAKIKFREEIKNGAVWDDTTPNIQIAEKQIDSLVTAYLPTIKESKPVLIEQELKAKSGDWEIIGHLDLFDAAEHLDDLKTGALSRPYIQQLGAYVMLLESNGHSVKTIGTTFVKRVRSKKDQPPPIRNEFDIKSATHSAFAAIGDIQASMESFEDSGNPYHIQANPMSMMCSEKYCPAWGTEFCKLHL